jgi:hypothetical protein
VTVLDMDLRALQRIDERFPSVVTMIATPSNIARPVPYADVVVGAVLSPWPAGPDRGHETDGAEHEAALDDHRYEHRPGWLCGNFAPDDT